MMGSYVQVRRSDSRTKLLAIIFILCGRWLFKRPRVVLLAGRAPVVVRHLDFRLPDVKA
jgi:hypothetical protein